MADRKKNEDAGENQPLIHRNFLYLQEIIKEQ
jgi:hypothetical protein